MNVLQTNKAFDSAMKLFDRHNYKAAAVSFKSIVAENERHTEALFYLALSLLRLGQCRRSLNIWRRLEKISPAEANLHLNMGCAYQNLGQIRLAVRHFKRELKDNPVSGEALYNLGTLYYKAHQYKRAVGYLERCYSLKHSVAEIVDRLAYSYFKTDQIENEISLYDGFLQDYPNDTWCLNNMGAALMHLGEYSRAQMYLRKAANIDPKDQRVQRNLKSAEIYRRRARLVA